MNRADRLTPAYARNRGVAKGEAEWIAVPRRRRGGSARPARPLLRAASRRAHGAAERRARRRARATRRPARRPLRVPARVHEPGGHPAPPALGLPQDRQPRVPPRGVRGGRRLPGGHPRRRGRRPDLPPPGRRLGARAPRGGVGRPPQPADRARVRAPEARARVGARVGGAGVPRRGAAAPLPRPAVVGCPHRRPRPRSGRARPGTATGRSVRSSSRWRSSPTSWAASFPTSGGGGERVAGHAQPRQRLDPRPHARAPRRRTPPVPTTS